MSGGAERLAALYARVPSVDCIPGCHDCCGPVPLAQAEVAHFGPFPLARDGTMAIATALDCPNIAPAGCRIHANRPFICRLFGTVDPKEVAGTREARMACPHGRKPAKPLKGKQVRALMAEYLQISGDRS